MIDIALKHEITAALAADVEATTKTYPSRAKQADRLGINKGTLSVVLNKSWLGNSRLLSDKKWIEIANKIGFDLSSDWGVAETDTFLILSSMFDFCKNHSATAAFCDFAGIGKSFAANTYADRHSHVYVLEGSKAEKKGNFIRSLATIVGVANRGSLDFMLEQSIKELKSNRMNKPLLIFDEAGDFSPGVYKLLKRLYNELEDMCGMIFIGAEDFKINIQKGIRQQKNAFAEVWSRIGGKASSAIDTDITKRVDFYKRQTLAICEANGVTGSEAIKILATVVVDEGRNKGVIGDMRRVKKEILKLKYLKA